MPANYEWQRELEELLERRRAARRASTLPAARPATSRAEYMRAYRQGRRQRTRAREDLRDALDEIIGCWDFTTVGQHWPPRHYAPDVREDVYPWRDLIRRDLEDADLL